MSEQIPPYTSERFPYSGILEELTDRAKSMAPVEAYATFLDERDARDLDPYHFDYGSTSITTGGHAHYMENIGEVIAANTRTARQMVSLLDAQGSIFGSRLILPVDLGKTGWDQSGYMTYWGLTIAGMDVRELKGSETGFTQFENDFARKLGEHGVELAVMNDPRVEREERRPYYDRFVAALAEAMHDSRARCLPAYRLISLVDPDISLGCWAEKRLADRLDVPTQRVGAFKPAQPEEAVPPSVLQDDLKVIMANGGQVLVAPRGTMLNLVGDAAL